MPSLITNSYFTTTSIILTCLTPTPASEREKDYSTHTHTHTHLLTFSDDDRDCVATLQLPLISYCQGKLVRADLQTCHRGNSTVCILDLHTIGTPGGGTDGQKEREFTVEGRINLDDTEQQFIFKSFEFNFIIQYLQ